MRRGTGLAVLLLGGLSARRVHADPEPGRAPVSLAPVACADLPDARVRSLVAIELDLVDEAAAPTAETTRMEVRCEGDIATLEVVDPVTGKSLRRRIDLGSVAAAARTRLVALAIVELVSASWFELIGDPEPRAPSLDRTASEPTRRAAVQKVRARLPAPPTPRLRLGIAGGARLGGRPAFASPGAGFWLEHDVLGVFGWGADLSAEQARVSTTLGDVRIRQLSGALVLLARADLGAFTIAGGPGARVGVVSLEGMPSQDGARGDTLVAPWGGPLVTGRLLFAPTAGVVVRLAAEAGWITSSVGALVGGTREIALEGPWAAISLGVGLSFGGREPVSRGGATEGSGG